MDKFTIGDPVLVLCDGLAMLREHGAPINHHGWVHEIWDDGTILIEFPIGDDDPDEHSQVAPYAVNLVRPREGKRRRDV